MIPEKINIQLAERSILKLTLYSRPGCHLCDDMVTELADCLGDRPYQLDIVDINSDPEFQTRYAARIPLLMLDGTPVAEHFFDRGRLTGLLGDRKYK